MSNQNKSPEGAEKSKIEQFIEKLGVELPEDKDVDTFFSEFQQQQTELFLKRGDILDPIKEGVKKEASIVTMRKAKKDINTAFGLGLTNSQLDELDYQDLVEKAKTAVSSNANADEIVKKYQADLMAKAQEVERVSQEWEQKYNSAILEFKTKEAEKTFENALLLELGKSEFIISNDYVKDIIRTKMKADNIDVVIEDGKMKLKQSGHELFKDDKTGLATLPYLIDKYVGEVKKKSNGSGTNGKKEYTKEDFPEGTPADMIAHARRLRQLAGGN